MNQVDIVADKFAVYEGFRLADYRAVALPYYVLYVDAILIEYRPLPPTTEFVLNGILIGINSSVEIAGLLGLAGPFTETLLSELTEERYLERSPEDIFSLGHKGREVLATSHVIIPEERQIPILWNSISGKPADFVETLLREADLRRGGTMPIRAFPMRPPEPDEISIHEVRRIWSKRKLDESDTKKEVIRLGAIRRRALRFRPAVALVYVPEKGKDSRVKFAIDGTIDEGISQAFAEQSGPKRHGIEDDFQRRAATLSLRQRLSANSGGPAGSSEYLKAISRRSVLRLSVAGLERRLAEENSDENARRLEEKKVDLLATEGQINNAAVRQIFPFEVPQLVELALANATKEIVITTTVPVPMRCDMDLIQAIRRALARKVSISIYISGRIEDYQAQLSTGRRSPISELNKLATEAPGLSVRFLTEKKRAFYEILQDRNILAVSNEPPMGARDLGTGFRPFTGMVVSDKRDIESYWATHFDPQCLSFVDSTPTSKRTVKKAIVAKNRNRRERLK